MNKKGEPRKKLFFIILLVVILLVVDALSIFIYLRPTLFIPGSTYSENSKVTAVIDGQTLTLENGETVKLIGLIAPELGQAYFEQSKNFLSTLTQNKTVRLEKGATDRDSNGNLLRYVYSDLYGKEVFVNLESIKQGYSKLSDTDRYPLDFAQARIYCLENKLNICA